MRLYNAIAIYDVYIVAESSEAAREALLSAIREGEARPMEITATETTREGAIRSGFREDRPFVASDISDDDFEKCKGKTTTETFALIYTKRGQP